MQTLFLPLGLAALIHIPVLAQSTLNAEPGKPNVSVAPLPSQPLTLAQAVQWAMQANPELAAAVHEVEAWDGISRQAGVIPNPELVASVEDHEKATRTSTLQFNQPIELGGKRGASMRSAEQGRHSAAMELDAKRLEIRAATIAAFYELLVAQERYVLASTSAELARQTGDATAKRVLAGKISPVEANKARIAQSGAQLEFIQAETELGMARQRLSALFGTPAPRFDRVQGDLNALPQLAEPDRLAARLQESPHLRRAQSEVAYRQALSEVERSKQIGNVTVGVGAKRDEELRRTQAVVGISIPLPLFDRNQGNLQEALSRTEKARSELSATEIRLRAEVAQLIERFKLASREVQALQQDVLPAAQATYEAAAKGFEYGKFGALDVLDAQRTFLQTKSHYLRALHDTYRAYSELERLVGPLDMTSSLEQQ